MELTLDQALQKGVEAHKVGKIQEADRYYTAILKANPKHPDANHNMGVLAVGVGKVEEALPFFKTALEVNPSAAQYWLSYIDALIKLDRIADAKALFDNAKSKGARGDRFDQIEKALVKTEVNAAPIKLQEPNQEQLQSLINLYTRGQSHEALIQASQLLKQFPNSINLCNIIGITNKQLGKREEAIQAYTKAISLKPDYADAYFNMANALKDLVKLDEAIEAYTKAISLKPDYAEAYNNMGIALKEQGKLEKAIEAYKKALSIKPDYAEAYNNMGGTLKDQGKLEKAIKAYNKALSIKPDYAEAYNNIGGTFQDQGRLDKAIGAYNKALSLKPDYVLAIENASSLRNQISDTALINEEFEKRLESARPQLIKMPKVQIHKAVTAFVSNDRKSVREHLNGFNGCSSSAIAKLTAKDQVFCSSYNHFLQKLIEKPFENERPLVDHRTVFHLGESHCLSYAHRLLKLNSTHYNIVPRITIGGKAYHFSTEKENVYKAITKSNFDSLTDGCKVFVSFGEIDCRPNEGFISAAKKHKKPIGNLVANTVKGYVDWFAKQNQSKNHSLFLFNVPAPIYNEKYSEEVNIEVIRTIKLFNSLLYKTVLDHDFNIIDVYKFTVGKNGFSNGFFHIDKKHLSSDAIPEIEKQIGTFS